MDTKDLYDLSEKENIEIINFSLPKTLSQSQMDIDGNCYIAIDICLLSAAEEKVCIGHEMGHCEKGAFYNIHSKLDVRSRHEYRADKWAIQHLIQEDDLKSAIKSGLTENWQLADHFEVTEDFMLKAIHFYKNQELARC